MKNNILNVLKKELRETFRDKKSLGMMLIVPLMIPLIIFGMSALYESQTDLKITDYNQIGFAYELSDFEKQLAKEMEIEVITGDIASLKKSYEEGNIDLYVTKDANSYILNGEESITSSYASSLVDSYLNSYKSYLQSEILTNHNLNPSEIMDIITIDYNISTEENFYSNYIMNYALLFVIMAMTISATYPATDATAGEKERGTLETLLTFPIKSKDIIVGKFLSVSLSTIVTGLISLVLALISLSFANDMFTIYANSSLVLGINSILIIVVVLILYSLLISGLSIAIASKCKTFKEAQSALTPLTFISFFPGMFVLMTEMDHSIALYLIPFLNISLIFDNLISHQLNIINLIITIISTLVIIFVVLKIIITQYKSEKVLFTS